MSTLLGPLQAPLILYFGQATAGATMALIATAHAGLARAQVLAVAGTTKAPRAMPLPPALAATVALTAAAAASAVAHLAAHATSPPLTPTQRVTFMHAASTLRAAAALLRLGFRAAPSYPTYDAVYGSSQGSSLTAGRAPSPWADLNPFAQLVAVTTAQVTQTVNAIQAARLLAIADCVVDAPLLPATVAAYAQTVSAGTAFP